MERLVRLCALSLTLLCALSPAAQGTDCVVLKTPEMLDILEGDRTVEIWWRDAFPESLTCIDQPRLGVAQTPWRGNASLVSGGFYTGACDFAFKFTVTLSDSARFQWTEVDWLTGSSLRRVLAVSRTDTPYATSDGITVTVPSEGLFTISDAERWSAPEPAFHGIYAGGADSAVAAPVVFTFGCAAGGELSGSGGSVVVDWSDDGGRAGTIDVESAGADYAVDRGLMVSFPAGTYATGDTLVMEALRPFFTNDQFSIDAWTFDGYHVLRHSVEDRPGVYKVMASIDRCDTAAFFLPVDGTRYFVDRGIAGEGEGVEPDPDAPTVLNGFPYEYSVVTYDVRSGGANPGELVTSDPVPYKVYPTPPAGSSLSDVYVVPNPYLFQAGWEESPNGSVESKLQFLNVPQGAEIRIFDTTGNYIQTVRPAIKFDGETQSGRAEWDLKNAGGEDIVSGIYIYYITAGGSERVGRFIVVR